jgi:hypothetical protein
MYSESIRESGALVDSVFTIRSQSCRRSRSEDGYVMLTLMLAVALLVIFAMAVSIPVKFELRRERETEMIHRGVQYSRAIRNYYKKFGRYPTRIEDLENTNNLRYLRKRYKDPITGKDFKLLHYGDPGLALTGSIGGGGIPGANTVGQLNAAGANGGFGGGSGASPSSFGGGFGNSGGGFGGNSNSAFGGGPSGGFGGGSNSSFGGGFGNSSNGNSSNPNSSNSGTSNTSGSSATGSGTPGTSPDGTDATQGSTQVAAGAAQGSSSSPNQTVFGGGPIVGVASTSKESSIREFNKKKKYNEWQFIYDPTADRGGLLRTPYQPALQIANQINGQPGQNGQPGSPNSNGSSFGQPSSGFGNSGSSFGNNNSGFGNNNSSFGNGNNNSGFGNGTPSQPSNPPQ